MAREPDDDALSWGEEADPTYADPRTGLAKPRVARDTAGADEVDSADEFDNADEVDSDADEDDGRSDSSPRWAGGASVGTPVAASNAAAVTAARNVQAELAEDAAADDELAAAEAAVASQQLSSAALIGLGILGGVYLLYTVGWVFSVSRDPLSPSGFALILQRVGGVLAIAAPPLWFAVTLVVGRAKRLRVRISWLIIGVIVLLPWPFIVGR